MVRVVQSRFSFARATVDPLKLVDSKSNKVDQHVDIDNE